MITTGEVLADTYAWMAVFRDNPAYKELHHKRWLTTEYNIVECYYQLLKRKGEAFADEQLKELWQYKVAIDPAIVKRAMKIRLMHKHKKLSYVDAISYATALELDIPFLTGDVQFKDIPGVLFVPES